MTVTPRPLREVLAACRPIIANEVHSAERLLNTFPPDMLDRPRRESQVRRCDNLRELLIDIDHYRDALA